MTHNHTNTTTQHNTTATQHSTKRRDTCAARGHTSGSFTKERLSSNTGKPSRPTPTHLERIVKAPQDSLGILELCLSKSLHHPASPVSHEPDRFNSTPVHVKTRHQRRKNWHAKSATKRGRNGEGAPEDRARNEPKKKGGGGGGEREQKRATKLRNYPQKTEQNTIACLHRDPVVTLSGRSARKPSARSLYTSTAHVSFFYGNTQDGS